MRHKPRLMRSGWSRPIPPQCPHVWDRTFDFRVGPWGDTVTASNYPIVRHARDGLSEAAHCSLSGGSFHSPPWQDRLPRSTTAWRQTCMSRLQRAHARQMRQRHAADAVNQFIDIRPSSCFFSSSRSCNISVWTLT